MKICNLASSGEEEVSWHYKNLGMDCPPLLSSQKTSAAAWSNEIVTFSVIVIPAITPCQKNK